MYLKKITTSMFIGPQPGMLNRDPRRGPPGRRSALFGPTKNRRRVTLTRQCAVHLRLYLETV